MEMNGSVLLLCVVMMLGCSSGRPANPDVTNDKLLPCPDSPNCVSSQSPDKRHFIEPIPYEGKRQQARDRLVAVIQGMKRSKIVTVRDDYIYAEFISAFFHFVDDVEFFFDTETKIIHMRSASRIGYYDFGVNRKRLEEIKSMLKVATMRSG
jgi:uncharacterized protein (DUF1499 family)